MKKAIIRISTVLAIACLLLSTIVITASAATSSIAFSSNNPKVNDKVTVTVTLNCGEKAYSLGCSVEYNQKVLRFENGDDANGSAGVINIAGVSNGNFKSFKLNFTAIASGQSAIKVYDAKYVGQNLVETTVPGSSAVMTVTDAAKSANANLKSLTVSSGTLTPAFDPNKTAYTVEVGRSVEECKVYAATQDPNAKVTIEGDAKLQEGKNTRTVTVTAPSGAQKKYTVTITRLTTDKVDGEEFDGDSEEPYNVTVGGQNYIVATDISNVRIPKGFSASTMEYNGVTVAAAQDVGGNYILLYLKKEGENTLAPFVLGGDGATLKRLDYFDTGKNIYIYADIPTEMGIPSGYYTTTVTIDGVIVPAIAKENTKYDDFSYIYCYYDNQYCMYRYDEQQHTIQRYPEIVFSASAGPMPEKDSFFKRFNSLDANAKIVVIGLVLLVICLILLVIFFAIRLARVNSEYADEDEDEDLDFEQAEETEEEIEYIDF